MLGGGSTYVLHLNVLVFKWKPRRQNYSEVKTELEFPSPIHIINEIIPQQCLLAHRFEMSALRQHLWPGSNAQKIYPILASKGCITHVCALSIQTHTHTYSVDLQFY